MSNKRLDTDKIARGLGGRKKAKLYATGGFPGAAQLAAEVQERFRVPPGGGRPTDPSWSDKRLVPLAPMTLTRLQRMAKRMYDHTGFRVEPMQLAAILLETMTARIEAEETAKSVSVGKGARAREGG